MHAWIDRAKIQLLTGSGLDWSHLRSLRSRKVKSAYLDGELCALNADGVPVFSRLQAAMDEGRTDQPIFFALDLLYLNGESTALLPLSSSRSDCIACSQRKSRRCGITSTSSVTVG